MLMSRLVASDYALQATLLLSQRPGGLRASEVGAALGISYTGGAKALAILRDEGLVRTIHHKFEMTDSARARESVRFALAMADPEVGLAAIARGNAAVEFCGVDAAGALVVLRRFAVEADIARLLEALETMRSFHPTAIVRVRRKEELRGELLVDLTARRRAIDMKVLAGSVDRSFPDRSRQGDFEAPALGRLDRLVPSPSKRRLRSLARRHSLRRIIAFGSATRVDFRPDSDLDLLVDPVPGRKLGLAERVDLVAEAEDLFGRDVDLLTAPVRRASLASRIAREGVVLYDAAG